MDTYCCAIVTIATSVVKNLSRNTESCNKVAKTQLQSGYFKEVIKTSDYRQQQDNYCHVTSATDVTNRTE